MKLLTPELMHDYQKKLVNFQCTRPHSMIWADMGLGKTVTTLTSIVHLINTGFLRGVIIVAPIRVIRLVWRQEAAKWEHTKHLRFVGAGDGVVQLCQHLDARTAERTLGFLLQLRLQLVGEGGVVGVGDHGQPGDAFIATAQAVVIDRQPQSASQRLTT